MKNKYTMVNRHSLVKPSDKKETLDNGLNFEAKVNDRKEILVGTIVNPCRDAFISRGEEILLKVDEIIYYPRFAAEVITLEGDEYHLVNKDDIIMIKEREEN